LLTAPGAATRPELAALVQQLFCLLQSVAAPPTPNPSGRCCPKAKPTLAANPCLAGNRLTPPPQDLAPPSAACLDRPNGSRYQPLPGEKQSLPPPTSQAEADALLKGQEPPADSYLPLIRLGQLPTAAVWNVATFQISIQQVSPTSGGASGGSGNQNYSLRGDFALLDNLLLSAYLTDADDPLYKAPASKPSNPGNRWVVYGTALKGRLAVGKAWQWAAEGAIELFNVCSGASGADSCTSADPSNTSNYSNIFNDSSTPVFNRNLEGSIALPLSWQANQKLQLSFVPAVTWLPASQGAGQGGAGQFFGTNISLGVGANYRPTPQLQLFGSAMVPLGPGYNGFDSNLVYSRTPILSVGTNFAVNPRIGLEASITNGYGLSPGTAILALPSAPWQPMQRPLHLDTKRTRFQEPQLHRPPSQPSARRDWCEYCAYTGQRHRTPKQFHKYPHRQKRLQLPPWRQDNDDAPNKTTTDLGRTPHRFRAQLPTQHKNPGLPIS